MYMYIYIEKIHYGNIQGGTIFFGNHRSGIVPYSNKPSSNPFVQRKSKHVSLILLLGKC